MKILTVCLGNICRSPLAHGILADIVKQKGLDWTVDSAGTGNWHVGQAPDHRAIRIATDNGIDISGQRAQHFQSHLFDEYDLILVMDHQNHKDVMALAETDAHRDKIELFLENDAVQDPYFDDALFDPVFHQIRKRCVELVDALLMR